MTDHHDNGAPSDPREWLATATVAAAVFELQPDYRALLLTADGLHGGPSDAVSERILADAEATARRRFARQLAHFQPAGDHPAVAVGAPPYGRMLPGIRGLRPHVTGVAAKFKYDDSNPSEHRAQAAARLESRATGRDLGAATQQRRRLGRVGTWRHGEAGDDRSRRPLLQVDGDDVQDVAGS